MAKNGRWLLQVGYAQRQNGIYNVTQRELLAVIFALKTFRQYLLGLRFTIRTDHAALQWLKKTPTPIGQQARWVEQLEEFDYDIQHRPGHKHGNADALPRRPGEAREMHEETLASVRAVKPADKENEVALEPLGRRNPRGKAESRLGTSRNILVETGGGR